MDLNKWFDKGITPETYIELLEKHKDSFTQIYNNFKLPTDDDFFESLEEQNLRAVVLAEPWCGHCMLTVPVFLRLAEKTAMPVRFLLRDENLELMDQHLTNGKSRSIPIYLFIDKDGNEVKKWGPIANKTKQFTDEQKAKLPSKDAEDYDEKFKELITVMTHTFHEDSDFWYGTYDSMKQVLK